MEKWNWIKKGIEIRLKDDERADEMIEACERIQKKLDENGYGGETEAWKRDRFEYEFDRLDDICTVASDISFCTACVKEREKLPNGYWKVEGCEKCKLYNPEGYCDPDVEKVIDWLEDVED